jgi:hypothetical protein
MITCPKCGKVWTDARSADDLPTFATYCTDCFEREPCRAVCDGCGVPCMLITGGALAGSYGHPEPLCAAAAAAIAETGPYDPGDPVSVAEYVRQRGSA